jgi:hypothetical protein
MAGKTTYLERAGMTTYLKTATAYAALFTAAPTDAGGGTECADAGYTATGRLAVTFGSFTAAPSSGSRLANTNQLDFGVASGGGYTVVAVGLYDAVTGGNLLYWATVTSTAIATSSRYQIAIGGLTADED